MIGFPAMRIALELRRLVRPVTARPAALVLALAFAPAGAAGAGPSLGAAAPAPPSSRFT